MTWYLRPGIPVSSETRQHWKDAGFTVMKAPRNGRERTRAQLAHGDILLNYGSTADVDILGQHLAHHMNLPELVHRTRVENIGQYIGDLMPYTLVYGRRQDYYEDSGLAADAVLEHPHIIKMNGMKGRNKWVIDENGIHCCPPQGPLETHLRAPFVMQRFIHPATEYRVLTLGIPGVKEPDVLAWSRKDTDPYNPQTPKVFHYLPRYTLPEKLAQRVLEAHQRLGLDYVGWDVLDDGETYWIIEANSAPGLGDVVSRRLKKKLAEWLGGSHG